MKRILIVHFHLNPGGVTRIIESQVHALHSYTPYRVKVLTGAGQLPGIDCEVNEQLNYLPERESEYRNRYRYLENYFEKQLHPGDILHIHNASLGKNPILTIIISELAKKGHRIVNHIHDFAEDRKQNMDYIHQVVGSFFQRDILSVMYPILPNYHYCVLTSHDLRRLNSMGIPESHISLLPNPVAQYVSLDPTQHEELKKKIYGLFEIPRPKLMVIYPVRVIKRKNIGEFVLLAALFQEKAAWLVTQPPLNPVEIPAYEHWKGFCSKNNIHVIFEAGISAPFNELMIAADFCITTSVLEGFGMVFLEPWNYGVPVIGRKIPNTVDDFINTGLFFPLLYDSLFVHVEGRKIDFASLTDEQQARYIEYLLNNNSIKKELFDENQFLGKLLTSIDKRVIEKNRKIIQEHFSIRNYAIRLERIYKKVAGKPNAP